MRIHLNNLLNIPVKFIHLRIVKYLSSHSLPPSYPFRNFPARRMQASAAETEASRRRCRKTFEEAFPNPKSRGVLLSIRRCRRLRYVLVWTLFASRITSQTETHTRDGMPGYFAIPQNNQHHFSGVLWSFGNSVEEALERKLVCHVSPLVRSFSVDVLPFWEV